MQKTLLTLFAGLLLQQATLAQTNTWTGATDNNWNTATNWSTAQVPAVTDNVSIPGTATNQPTISAAGAAAKTVEVQSGATLTISSTGVLAVNGSKAIFGFSMAFFNGGAVNNSGQLLIGNLSAVGDYGLYNEGYFNNNTGGQISIDRSTSSGLYNRGGTFTNAATITIGAGAAVGGIGLQNKATFNNNGCAVLNLYGPFFNIGLFSNAGLSMVSTTGAHSNTGFTNNGILDYPQGNPIPNVTNAALVVLPVAGCGTTLSPALQVAASNPFVVGTTWYTDAALTTTAGIFNSGTNTFAAPGLMAGTTTVYFGVSNGASCTQTVAIPVTVKPVPGLTSTLTPPAICNQATFSYTPASDLTGTTFNWSRAVVSGIANTAAGGTGSISEALTNTTSAPVQVTYAYTLTNTNGCSSASPYNVMVTVKPPPAISCPPNITVNPTSLSGAVVNYPAPVGSDNCTGAIPTRTAGPASGAVFPIGTTTVTYKVGNAPNTVSCSFTVTVRNPYDDNKEQKVYVCHSGKTLSIIKNDVQSHLQHGDELGRCDWYNGPQAVTTRIAAVTTVNAIAPSGFGLTAVPNPFAHTIRIQHSLPMGAQVSINVYDVLGREISTLFGGARTAGTYSQVYNTSKLSSGVYYIRLVATAGGKEIVQTQKLVKAQ